MTAIERAAATAGWLDRWRSKAAACRGLQASAVLGAAGLAALVAMYASFGIGAQEAGLAFGWVNDVLGIVTCPLALPAVLRLHALLGERTTVDRRALALLEVVGIASIGSVSALQAALVVGAMPFETQVRFVIPAFLALGAWFIVSGRLAAAAGIFPGGGRLGLAAAAYAGYPLWAWRLADAIGADRPRPAGLTSADPRHQRS